MTTNLCRTSLTAAAALALAASSAHATFFSFASDTNDNAYTFSGSAGNASTPSSFTLTNDLTSSFSLRIDDNNGAAPEKFVQAKFFATLTVTHANSALIAGTTWRHTYSVTGFFGFNDAITNTLLLRADIGDATPALMTAIGSENSWSSSGAVLGADSFSTVTYTATDLLVTRLGGAAVAALYGIVVPAGGQASSVGPDDFGFDLTAVNTGTPGVLVGLDPTRKTPTTSWKSESSYSGSALNGIPAPSAAGLLGLAGLIVTRRRRA